jgi:hypothetical protein
VASIEAGSGRGVGILFMGRAYSPAPPGLSCLERTRDGHDPHGAWTAALCENEKLGTSTLVVHQ